MRLPVILMIIGLLMLPLVLANPSGTNVVISEVLYDPSGEEQAAEYIELYNPTASDIDISGWTLYEGSTGLVGGNILDSGSVVPAHGYFLIVDFSASLPTPATYPVPDALFVMGLSNGGEGLRLADSSLDLVDAVGWAGESNALFLETAPTADAPDGKSIERKQGGNCGNAVDTDNNAADFIISTPTPQNSDNDSIIPCDFTPDTTPPGPVSNLAATSITNQSITWQWTNPADSDFAQTIIYINGVNFANLSKTINSTLVSSLSPNTQYTILINTKDTSGNVNIAAVSNTQTTLSNPAPVVPTVLLTSPANNSIIATSTFQVDFSALNWVVGGKGTNHIHFHISDDSGLLFGDHLMFYNGADNVVEKNTDAGPTPFATRIDSNTIQFNNVPDGVHTIRAHLASAIHAVPGNQEADTFIRVTVSTATCIDDLDCDDGLFCNGDESCVSGSCQAGTPIVCDDGEFCNGVEVCDEEFECVATNVPAIDDGVSCTQDSCDENSNQVIHAPNNALCADGAFCNGQEICNAATGCQSGSPVVCNNGLFCDGTETCDEGADSCADGADPVVNDGVSCTQDSCDENSNQVIHAPNNALCQDGEFCNGQEVCNVALGCQGGVAVSCAANNIAGVNSCNNNPDNNPKTADFRTGFISSCIEATDSCTTGSPTITHACSLTCGASCTQNSDCGFGEVCDPSSCACTSDGILRPDVTILTPANGSTTASSDVLVSFSVKDWNVSGKTKDHIYFTISNVAGLNSNDQLHFYNGPHNVVELANAPTSFASWVSNTSFMLHNIGDGVHTLSAQLVHANNTLPATSNAKESITFTTILPVCGDNAKNQPSEVCDGSDLAGKTCVDFGFSNPNELSCALTCDGFSTTNCIATCGDGNKEPSEQCDDDNLQNGDGCSSLCMVEYTDDLQIDYLRGKITFDGIGADNETQYTVQVISGQNEGISFSGYADDSDSGDFDTKDQLMFSSGDAFNLSVQGCNTHHEGTFANGGNLGIYLNCSIVPEFKDVYHLPSQPHDLEDAIIYANVSDNSIDTVELHYTINDSAYQQSMNLVNGLYQFNIGTLALGSNVSYFIEALDNYGNMTTSVTKSFTVITHDFDKDGSNFTADCNDFDNTIYPGALEVVDGIDQNCVNDAPQFNGIIANQNWNEDFANSNAFDLDNYFTDVDNDGLLAFSFTNVSPIAVDIGLDNSISFSQDANWNGVKQITFTATDGNLQAPSNVVTLTVAPIDDAPRFLFNISNITVKETQLVNVNASGQVIAVDDDNEPVSYSYICSPLPCNLGTNGKWTPAIGNKGTYSANVTATAGALSVKQTMTITVTKKYPGDINGDNAVNILDLQLTRKAFGKTPSSPDWNPDWDMNNDGLVNILDLQLIRKAFT